MSTIDLTYENDDGDEVVISLPCKMEVCPECKGHGYILSEGLRGVAFTPEEFNETFDDDESRSEYFRRGGMYDQVCDECHGKNVVAIVDEKRLTDEQKVQYAEYQQYKEDEWACDADIRAERDAERRAGCQKREVKMEVQTRSEENGLRQFNSIKEAMEHAKKDSSVWKISFSVGDEQIRLVKKDNQFVYEPIKFVNNHFYHHCPDYK